MADGAMAVQSKTVLTNNDIIQPITLKYRGWKKWHRFTEENPKKLKFFIGEQLFGLNGPPVSETIKRKQEAKDWDKVIERQIKHFY